MLIKRVKELLALHSSMPPDEYAKKIASGKITPREIGSVTLYGLLLRQVTGDGRPTELELSFVKLQYPSQETWSEVLKEMRNQKYVKTIKMAENPEVIDNRRYCKITITY